MDQGSAGEVELAETWSALGIDPSELTFRGETAVASHPLVPDSMLPSLRGAPENDKEAPLRLGDVLGEGGMGVVRAATQNVLQRQVAVKTLRSGDEAAQQELQLLREGLVTGSLEHPNIIPIHTIANDEQGRPMLVMKRVEGRTWLSELEEIPVNKRLEDSCLTRHLGILRQVAHALQFAHERGVLHRDIKPENVMVGSSFGEVYLVDWGIAVSFGSSGVEGTPHVEQVKAIEGTPVYMAPEMAAGRGSAISVSSDVYLLGATLHHFITGAPPHEAGSLHGVLLNAFLSAPPSYAERVPAELAEIASKAMAREPSDRYPTAAAFAEALGEFLEHRGSLMLGAVSTSRAKELRELSDHGGDDERIQTLFNEARFGFEQALRSWPGNEVALQGRRALLESMAQHELARGAPKAAETLMKQHEEPPEDLVAQIAAAIAAESAKATRLRTLQRDVDPSVGERVRAWRTVTAGIGWGLTCLGCAWLTHTGIYPINHRRFAIAGLIILGINLTSTYLSRRELLTTVLNRRIVYTSAITFGLSATLWPILGAFGLSMAQTTVVGSLVAAVLWSTVTFELGRGWLLMSLGHLPIPIAAYLLPKYHFEIFGFVAVPTLIAGGLMLSRQRRRQHEAKS